MGIKLEEKLGGGGGVKLGFLKREWDWEIGVRDAIEGEISCQVLYGIGVVVKKKKTRGFSIEKKILKGLNLLFKYS